MSNIYDFKVLTINDTEQDLNDYQGQVLLIVNTASKCGFTPQFAGLERLYQTYKDQGFKVLGFPSNQFANQDPGNNAEINEFCQINYGVSFPMFAKIDVNGKNAAPIYNYITKEAKGLFSSEKIKWNFTKFLIGRDGKVIERFAPTTKPESMAQSIEKALAITI